VNANIQTFNKIQAETLNEQSVAINLTQQPNNIEHGKPIDFSEDRIKPIALGNQVFLVNIQGFLTKWNEKMHWGFSSEQIEQYNQSLRTGLLKKYQKYPGSLSYNIPDMQSFCLEVGDAIGLTRNQSEVFANAADEDLRNAKKPKSPLLTPSPTYHDINITNATSIPTTSVPMNNPVIETTNYQSLPTEIPTTASDVQPPVFEYIWEDLWKKVANLFKIS